MSLYSQLCNIPALDAPSYGSCTSLLSRRRSNLGTCQSWSISDTCEEKRTVKQRVNHNKERPTLPVSESQDGALLADVALGLVPGGLGGHEPVQHRQPHHGLGLLLHPAQEVQSLEEKKKILWWKKTKEPFLQGDFIGWLTSYSKTKRLFRWWWKRGER